MINYSKGFTRIIFMLLFIESSAQVATDINLKNVYDLDNNKYTVIKIGKQYWFKENLRTTQYKDTTPIATGLSDNEWKQTKKGAYAVYDNKNENDQQYGKLYNGFAVATGKLCPKGWRIPTDKDWNELEQFLGIPKTELERTGERGNIADKLKISEGWKASAFLNNNSSGFSILPAGSRQDNGEYSTQNQYGNFWTSTVYDDRYGLLYLWNHHVHYNTHAVGRIYTLANNGYSCRCVTDSIVSQKTNSAVPVKNTPVEKKTSPEYQTVSYDLATFAVPKTWSKETGNISVSYLTADTKTGDYGKIIIYKSLEGTGSLQTDFDAEWNELVATPYKTTSMPETVETGLSNNWKVKSGVAPFVFNKRKSKATLLTAISDGTKISLLFLTNTENYRDVLETFTKSIQLNKTAATSTNNIPITTDNKQTTVSGNYTFTTSNFDDGWVSTVQKDYVLVEKNDHSVYLNFSVPYNASQFSGTGVRDAEYYWDNYVTTLFNTKSKQFNDGGSLALKPPYMEGNATDKRTGKPCFIGMYLNIVPNAVSIIIGTAPTEAAFRLLFPKANDPFGSDLSAMTRYNKFAVAANDLIGKWQNGNTATAQWYYISPSGYENYAGMTLAATSATFYFNNNGIYSSIHNGATGAVGNMNTFQQEYKGNYSVSNWMITATNRYEGKTDKFDASFMAVRGGRILKINNGAGQDYSLVKIK